MTYGLHDNIKPADVGVILGNHVHRNGTPSYRLAARLNKGIELYRQGLIQNIIVSGGINRHGIGEGSAMKNYLMAHRIRASAIFVDNRGANT
ncbi:MAG: YdcF family protein, partial [Gammaproteobacteria bacterium]|nr:YdcF family protein [Gammaproteobacteria bacterium]